jgi:hypothetical protein
VAVGEGANVDIKGSLFEQVQGAGAIFKNPGLVTIAESKFVGCRNSGLELNQTEQKESATIESCVFEANENDGLYSIGGRLTVKKCDFVGNAFAGLDVRNCTEFTVEDVFSRDNGGGGYAISNSQSGTIEGAYVGGSQAFGIAIRDRSVVKVTNLSVTEGSSPAFYVGSNSDVEIEDATIDGASGPGLLVQGQGTKVKLTKVDVKGAGSGLQILDGAEVTMTGGKFVKNGVHVDIARSGTLTADNGFFEESRDGVGVVVEPTGSGKFTKCAFARETKAGIAVGGSGTILESTVEGCQLAGIYWYDAADGSIEKSTIQNNEQCGIVIMGGKAKLVENKVEGHTIYGLHVHTGLGEGVEVADDNEFLQNTIADKNYED